MKEVAELLNGMREAGVVPPDYLATIALSAGRPKDFNRVIALLDGGAVDREAIERLSARHGLTEKWAAFNEEVPR